MAGIHCEALKGKENPFMDESWWIHKWLTGPGICFLFRDLRDLPMFSPVGSNLLDDDDDDDDDDEIT